MQYSQNVYTYYLRFDVEYRQKNINDQKKKIVIEKYITLYYMLKNQ